MHPMTLPAALTPPHSIDPASLAALPRTSGVYVFKGEGALPIYIGKSVDIRSRVLSHLRAADEAEMIAQCRRVEYIETAGEFGALLLEARLIKQLSPLFNIRLRRVRNLCSIQLSDLSGAVTPEIVTGKDVAVGQTEGLYGLFSSVRAPRANCVSWPTSTCFARVCWGWRRSANGAALVCKSEPAWGPVSARKTATRMTGACCQHWKIGRSMPGLSRVRWT